MHKLIVSALYIYPIKSCGSISLTSSLVEKRGLQYDRRWMLVDENFQFITQRTNSKLAWIRPSITEQGLVIHHFKSKESLQVPFISEGKRVRVTVWDDECDALLYDKIVNEWFSDQLSMNCRLVYMPDWSMRQIDLTYAPEGEVTAFNDGYPILLLSEKSMENLNAKMEKPLPISRFRPNIVFSGGYDHQEDDLSGFSINDAEFEGVKLCARCNVPTIDQGSLLSTNEPTATLATYRLKDKKILFGQNVLVKKTGSIRVGDVLNF